MTHPPPRGSETSLVLTHLMQPADANFMGNIHGGVIMKLIDEAAGACAYPLLPHARRHRRHRPHRLPLPRAGRQPGARCRANVNYAGTHARWRSACASRPRTSTTGVVTHTNSAYLVFVALGDERQAHPGAHARRPRPTQQKHWYAEARGAARASASPSGEPADG